MGAYSGLATATKLSSFYNDQSRDLQARAREEFALLVRDQLRAAAAILAHLRTEAVRKTLVSSLSEIPLRHRRALASHLEALEIPLEVPGIDDGKALLWRRSRQATAPGPSTIQAGQGAKQVQGEVQRGGPAGERSQT